MKLDKAMPLIFSALLALEAWTLKSVVDLKVQVADLAARVSTIHQATQIAKIP